MLLNRALIHYRIMTTALPPRVSHDMATEYAANLRDLACRLENLVDVPTGEWGLGAADVGQELIGMGSVLADSGAAVAALEGHSIRAIAEELSMANSALPGRLAGTPELADYAEETKSGRRVTQGGISRALYDIRHDQYTVEGQPERVPRRRKRGS